MTARTNVDIDVEAIPGQASYTPLNLLFYDWVILGLFLRFIWRCPSENIQDLYQQNIGKRHLDIGVGTGYFLDHCAFSEKPEIHLLDLNENCLRTTAQRLSRYSPKTVQANALKPLPLGNDKFDSVALSMLLHCLPGNLESKAVIFRSIKAHLAPGGVVFGGTILTGGVEQTILSRALLAFLNSRGVFTNAEDDLSGLDSVLKREFSHYEIKVSGSAALFTARI